ncbi:HNH endonuclease domain-containing protein [Tropicimonas marinistellae]|uniref:HNH endonuclease domain-containing protein n=1 Tax=Tropicimonas marinistellae TaxID=1739787 RepID=UPI00082F1B1E|nr:HNH endonuclease domain-containing protein [Tropicimonas marinistellae]
MEKNKVVSIYSGNFIDTANFDLDHFLPRAFVAHDRFWNLTPIESGLNAEKSDLLPDLGFVPRLAHQHSMMARHAMSLQGRAEATWRLALDEYATDLQLDSSRLQNPAELERVYNEAFSGLAGIAKRMGFPDGWRPNGAPARSCV